MENEVIESTLKPSEKMARVDKWLDEFEGKLGLPTFNDQQISKEVAGYMSMSQDRLERLSPEQCGEIAVILASAAFTVQRAYNREVSHVTWADGVLRLGVAGKTTQYRGSFMQQEEQVIKDDDYLLKVAHIKSFAQQRVDRLSFLGSALQKISDKIEKLKSAKDKKL